MTYAPFASASSDTTRIGNPVSDETLALRFLATATVTRRDACRRYPRPPWSSACLRLRLVAPNFVLFRRHRCEEDFQVTAFLAIEAEPQLVDGIVNVVLARINDQEDVGCQTAKSVQHREGSAVPALLQPSVPDLHLAVDREEQFTGIVGEIGKLI